LPSGVRGPVECSALARLIWARVREAVSVCGAAAGVDGSVSSVSGDGAGADMVVSRSPDLRVGQGLAGLGGNYAREGCVGRVEYFWESCDADVRSSEFRDRCVCSS